MNKAKYYISTIAPDADTIARQYGLGLEIAEYCTAWNMDAVFVSDYIYSDAERYSESTEMYRKCLAGIDRRLAACCDTVIEVSTGQFIIHKGDLCI